jgi:branched-chain amino acid transport system permease protein
MTFVQIVIVGILVGALWGVLGLGKQLILGKLRFVNFAHANFALIGMYLMYYLWSWTKTNPYVWVPVVVIVTGALGLLLERPVVRPLVRRGERAQIVATLALLTLIQNIANLWMGPGDKDVSTSLDSSGWHLIGHSVFVTKNEVFTFVICVVAFVLVWWIMERTSFGLRVRATAQARESGIYCGIDVERVYGRAFALTIALAGLVGALYAIDTPVNPNAATPLLILMFVVPILGGLGSLPGALLGGTIVGILQGLTTQVLPPQLENSVIYVVFLIVLLTRPQGLIGSRAALFRRAT